VEPALAPPVFPPAPALEAPAVSPSLAIFGRREDFALVSEDEAGPPARPAATLIPGIVIGSPVISILRTDLFKPGPVIEPEPIIKPEPVVEPAPVIKPEPVVEPEPVIKPEPVIEPEPVVEPAPPPMPTIRPVEPVVPPPAPIIEPEPVLPQLAPIEAPVVVPAGSLRMDWSPLPPGGLGTSPIPAATSPASVGASEMEPAMPFIGIAPIPSATASSSVVASSGGSADPTGAVSIQIALPAPILPSISLAPTPISPPPFQPSAPLISSSQPSPAPSASPSTLPPPQYTISLDMVRRSLSEEAVSMGAVPPPSAVLRPAGPIPPPDAVVSPRPPAGGFQSAADPYIQRAMGFRRLGLNDKAIQEYRRAIEADPRQPVARNNLADLLIEQGEKIDEAIEHVVEALQMDVTDPGPYYSTLGWAYARLGEYQNAERFLNDALKAGMTAERLYRRGRLYAAMGMAARARADYDRALVYSESSELSEKIRAAMNESGSEISGQGVAPIIR
jgi:Tfp pilus assembly protein PilF